MAKKILVIDDEKDILVVTKVRLQSKGYSVVTAESSEEALEILKTNIPDLIFLDLILPKMQGEEFCKKLKADPKYKKIPIIIFTAKVIHMTEDIKAMGANDFLIKPFETEDLILKVKKYIGPA